MDMGEAPGDLNFVALEAYLAWAAVRKACMTVL
jgi:hypothetical protein